MSEIDVLRVLRDVEVDVVIDERAEQEEEVEFQDEAVDRLLGRGRRPARFVSGNSMDRGEEGNAGDRGDSGSSRS